ncbi:MAG: hypothetical protein AAFY20_09000 [Cyanobacteria bacterium J06639_14]
MEDSQFVQLSAMPGWIVGVSHTKNQGYRCWVINPDLDVLNDGSVYTTSSAALAAGRAFIQRYY